MSVTNPGFQIQRQSVVGMEGMWVKMFDPPTMNPDTPDMMTPTNPVPEVMAAAGFLSGPSTPHTVQRDLLHGAKLLAYDGAELLFYLFRDKDIPATGGGNFPGATIRVPRGSVFHCESSGHGPPPHTIHWHGVEPTPMNDGVGHCSMEIGNYTYQFSPNFIGFYFCHCHRNTPQHFEFGLYQALIVDPPDAFFATQWNPAIPIGAGRDGLRRTAANLEIIGEPTGGGVPMDPASGAGFESLITRSVAQVQALFPGYVGEEVFDPDTEAGSYPGFPVTFPVNPHAKTVPYDVEALWVVDDRDSRWSEDAPNARATYPKQGPHPGLDDNFAGNWGGGVGANDFFSMNDFNPDYWYVTGVNFPGTRLGRTDNLGNLGTGVATISIGIVVPPELMSGVSGVQVPIEAQVGQTILVRVLDGAYNNITVRFPVPITIIGWDGRAMGVHPINDCNHAYKVPAGTPIHTSVARRFDALIRLDPAEYPDGINSFAEIDFTDTRCGTADDFEKPLLFTGRVPINIGPAVNHLTGTITDAGEPLEAVTVTVTGPVTRTALTGADGKYSFAGLPAGDYTVAPTLAGHTFTPASANVTIGAGAVPARDFAVAEQAAGTSDIGGTVVTSRGAAVGMPRIIVTLSGGANAQVVTDSEGHYHFTGLADGNYTVTPGAQISANAAVPGDPTGPSNMAFAFSPPKLDVTVSGGHSHLSFFRGRRTHTVDPTHGA